MTEHDLMFYNKQYNRNRSRFDARKKRIIFFILIAVLVSTMILTYVWTFVKMAEARVLYNKLKKINITLEKELNQLMVTSAKLSNPSRIEKLAKEKLNMTLPTRVEFLSIEYVNEEENTGEIDLSL